VKEQWREEGKMEERGERKDGRDKRLKVEEGM
jgi:hypothetical protein